METGEAVLWLELTVAGAHADAAAKMPADLQKLHTTATNYLTKAIDQCANLGMSADDGNTYFEFAQPLIPELNGKPEKILAWFKSTILAAHEFAATHCA